MTRHQLVKLDVVGASVVSTVEAMLLDSVVGAAVAVVSAVVSALVTDVSAVELVAIVVVVDEHGTH